MQTITHNGVSAFNPGYTVRLVCFRPIFQIMDHPKGLSRRYGPEIRCQRRRRHRCEYKRPMQTSTHRLICIQDSDAINRAISDGSRCGNQTCQSSTLTPALVYFPNRIVSISCDREKILSAILTLKCSTWSRSRLSPTTTLHCADICSILLKFNLIVVLE
jgi:hypothetical protein